MNNRFIISCVNQDMIAICDLSCYIFLDPFDIAQLLNQNKYFSFQVWFLIILLFYDTNELLF